VTRDQGSEVKRPKFGHPKLRRVAEHFGIKPEEVKKGTRSRDLIARFAGWSHETARKATAVVDAAKADPKRYGNLPAKMDAAGKVDGVYRELRRRQGHGLDMDLVELASCIRRLRRLLSRLQEQAEGMVPEGRALMAKGYRELADRLREAEALLMAKGTGEAGP